MRAGRAPSFENRNRNRMARGFHNLKFNLIVFRLKTWVYRNYLRVFVAFHSLVQIESFRSTSFVSIFMYIILKKRQPRGPLKQLSIKFRYSSTAA